MIYLLWLLLFQSPSAYGDTFEVLKFSGNGTSGAALNSNFKKMIKEFTVCLDLKISLVQKSLIVSAENITNFELWISEDLTEADLRFKGIWFNANFATRVIPHQWFSLCISYCALNHTVTIAKD